MTSIRSQSTSALLLLPADLELPWPGRSKHEPTANCYLMFISFDMYRLHCHFQIQQKDSNIQTKKHKSKGIKGCYFSRLPHSPNGSSWSTADQMENGAMQYSGQLLNESGQSGNMDCHGLATTGFIETRWAKRWRNTNMSHMSVKGCLSISMRSSAAPEKPGSPMTASAFSERRRRSLARCKLLCLKGARKAGGWAMGAMGGCRWFEELLRFVKTESGGVAN